MREQSRLHLIERGRDVSGPLGTAKVLHGAPRVALADNVITTGSTVAAAAAAVELWVVARASRRSVVRCAEP